MNEIFSLGTTAFITFGIVWAFTLFKPLPPQGKFALSVVVAIAVGFIPADLGNAIVNRVKDGVGVATALTGFYQMSSKLLGKIQNS